MSHVVVAKQFSRHPAGRFVSDGPYSGEAFRQKYLVPALKQGEALVIELDGARGYGSSFLEEAFGGLVRAGYAPARIEGLVKLVTSDRSLELEIWGYIHDAAGIAQ
ncbi:STAS-like domain-containing protein [Ralstonia pseudosolanacearum]|uniref:STAS-like domain-containing protein n=1 Tax=Ralstonia pseudosolanacearum TaxID=1310165 RepID=UPI0033992D76